MKHIVASHNPELARDFDRDLLRRRDLTLSTGRSAAEVLERVRAGADICFVDRILPEGDATLVLDALREDKRTENLPVVLVTSVGAPASDVIDARARGFDDVVELPAAPGALSLMVARLLGLPLREDERFAVRVHVFDSEAPASATLGDDGYLGTSLDLSEHGMLLKAKRDLAPGTALTLRFALPRGGELSLRAKVLRSDGKTEPPAKLLALTFDAPSDAERTALREYLTALIGGRPFMWQVTLEGGRQVVSLYGVLRGDSDLEALHSLNGDVWFRLRDFRRIGSDSVQRWIEFVRKLGDVKRLRLLECPSAFIHQANLIPNLLERQEVVSFFAPYACQACGLDEEKLIDVAADLDGGKRRLPPTFPCTGCHQPLQFDDLPEQYFSFLDR